MVKSPIRVFVRTRPVVHSTSKNLYINEKESSIHVNIPRNESQGHINNIPENRMFKFDGVLTGASQEKVFDVVAKDTIKSALEGFSGTIFCYGQTGAGKTFTMSGSTASYKERGVTPRTISALFQEINRRPHEQFEVKVSYLEIYNENMVDLLGYSQGPLLTINESVKGSIAVKGLNQIPCKKEEDCLNLLFQGEINKTMASHNLNQNSSRSHSIFTLYIQSKSRVGSTKKITYSKIHLVDLAGSERTKKTGSEGQTLIEANYINKSLSFLEQVVIALCEKQRDHVPYRQSKLTTFLKDSIGGNCKTIMIANIWPESSNLEETISTLKFATRIKNVSNDATANVWLDVASPQKQRESSQALSFGEALNDDSLSPEEQRALYKIARRFLYGRIDDIDVKSFAEVKELFHQFRNIFRDLFEATKDLFHLIPSDKLKKLGIRVNNNSIERTMIVNQSQTQTQSHNPSQSQSRSQSQNQSQIQFQIQSQNLILSEIQSQSQRPENNEDFEDLLDIKRKDSAKLNKKELSSESGHKSNKKLFIRLSSEREDQDAKSPTAYRPVADSKQIDEERKNIEETQEEEEIEEEEYNDYTDKEFEKKFFKRTVSDIRQKIQLKQDKAKQKANDEQEKFKFYGGEGEVLYLETEEEHNDELDIQEIKQRFKVRAEVLNNIKTKPFLCGLDDRRTKSLATNNFDGVPHTDRPYISQYVLQGRNIKDYKKFDINKDNQELVGFNSKKKAGYDNRVKE